MLSWPKSVVEDLCRLARFGANLTDAHSCFILLPDKVQTLQSNRSIRGSQPAYTTVLRLFGHHSLSADVVSNCMLKMDSGLIGWVAKHKRSIHVSPFEHDSSTLGTYSGSHQLKSFIGVPVNLASNEDKECCGVIACDSKKSFAFSKLQGKLLEELAEQVAHTLRTSQALQAAASGQLCFDRFTTAANALLQSLGPNMTDVLRIRPASFTSLEEEFGTAVALSRINQLWRLVKQALPPHYPFFVLPNGDALIVCDNMMSAFCENKVHAIATHVLGAKFNSAFSVLRQPGDARQNQTSLEGEIDYEYRRA